MQINEFALVFYKNRGHKPVFGKKHQISRKHGYLVSKMVKKSILTKGTPWKREKHEKSAKLGRSIFGFFRVLPGTDPQKGVLGPKRGQFPVVQQGIGQFSVV